MRKFEFVSYADFENKTLIKPKRATKGSAGYDFFSPVDKEILPGKNFVVITDIKVSLEEDEVLQIYPRSSYGYNRGMTLANTVGIIDSDYYNNPNNEGNISIKVINEHGKEPLRLKAGEAFAQGIFMKYLITDDDDTVEERVGGVGSTTKR